MAGRVVTTRVGAWGEGPIRGWCSGSAAALGRGPPGGRGGPGQVRGARPPGSFRPSTPRSCWAACSSPATATTSSGPCWSAATNGDVSIRISGPTPGPRRAPAWPPGGIPAPPARVGRALTGRGRTPGSRPRPHRQVRRRGRCSERRRQPWFPLRTTQAASGPLQAGGRGQPGRRRCRPQRPPVALRTGHLGRGDPPSGTLVQPRPRRPRRRGHRSVAAGLPLYVAAGVTT